MMPGDRSFGLVKASLGFIILVLVWGRSVKQSNRGLLAYVLVLTDTFGRVMASLALNTIVLVWGGSESKGRTTVMFVHLDWHF